jgi:hypothetical protein
MARRGWARLDSVGDTRSGCPRTSDLPDGPVGARFGTSGDLFVSSFNNSKVLRYDGASGAYKGVFASGGGLDSPNNITFMPVPEPSSWIVMGLGALVLIRKGRTAKS